ncbi:hypothetical protein BDR04DRAFT_1234206 [Suillus decipiens]|nr:hypothetical protein BDR04DRAFT_1234206 [Suillus decipiens]
MSLTPMCHLVSDHRSLFLFNHIRLTRYLRTYRSSLFLKFVAADQNLSVTPKYKFHTLLVSSSNDGIIKLWAFESRELLASFDIQAIFALLLSPGPRQLIYATYDRNICICDTPPDILTQARNVTRKKSAHRDLLNSDATRRPSVGHHRPPIPLSHIVPRPLPARDPQQPTFLCLSKLLRFSSRIVKNDQPCDLLDFHATLPLPSNRPPAECSPSTSLPRGRTFFHPIQSPSNKGKQKAREPKRKSVRVVDVPLGQATYGDEVGVDDGVRPYVVSFCLSWFQKKEKKPARRPVYDDVPESEEEEEDVVQPVVVSPGCPKPIRSQI